MEERRQFVRLRAPVDAAYMILPSGARQRTLTRDLSVGGVCLLMEKPVAPGAQIQLALTLPGREQPVNAIAEVAWSGAVEVQGRGGDRRSAEVGLRTVEIAPHDQAALSQFVTEGLRPGASN